MEKTPLLSPNWIFPFSQKMFVAAAAARRFLACKKIVHEFQFCASVLELTKCHKFEPVVINIGNMYLT